MRVRVNLITGLAAGALALMSFVVLAQAAPSTETKKPSVATAVAAAPNGQTNSIASAHQDQSGHGSSVATNASTEQPASAVEAKKHLAGVKYEDRTAATNGAQAGKLDAKNTQEKHAAVGDGNPHQ